MKYEQLIDAAFKRLGFQPRLGQREAVNQILEAYLDEGMQNVVLNASTGAGKSIIGTVVAECLTANKGIADDGIKSSISLTATNVLAKQYHDTYEKLEGRKFIMIKGANNYACSALSQGGEDETADACAWFTMMQNQSEFSDVLNRHCNRCEYLDTKKRRNTIRHLTTNYSFYFVDRMYTGKFEDRDLVIWDEAHLVNDLFSEHNAIYFSEKRVQQMIMEITDTITVSDVSIAKKLRQIGIDCGIPDKINKTNYQAYLRALQEIYGYVKEQGEEMAERSLRQGNMKAYTRYFRFSKKYEGLSCKIDDFFNYEYDHVFEYKEEEKACSVKPVFVGSMFDALQASPRNLFMSATVSGPFMIKTMNLNPQQTKFIKLPPFFPKENKEIVFFDPLSLSYTSLQNPETVKKLRKNAAKIVEHHMEKNDRGIVLAPSFKLQNEIISELQPLIRKGVLKLFEHKQGEKLEHIVAQFKAFKGTNAVLISPAMFEGIDLPGDLSRFQILVKAPFPSLGDKRMKYILDHHPDLYNAITIMKIVQGAGRSVRSPEDHAVTYILDQNAQRLFTGNHNVWKDEFVTRFTSFLE